MEKKTCDFGSVLRQLRKDCARYKAGVGPRLVAYLTNAGLAMDALCERAEKRKRRRNALGSFTPVPGEMLLGPQGVAWQIGARTICDLWQFEVGTDGCRVDEFVIRSGMHIAWKFHGKRTLLRMRKEAEKREIVANATMWDVGAAVKFYKDSFPPRCAVATLHSKVVSRKTSDAYPLANELYRPVLFLDHGTVTIRGVREDAFIEGPIILLNYDDSTTEIFPMK